MSPSFLPSERFTSWGRVIRAPHRIARPRFPDELGGLVSEFSASEPGLAVGLRRSYGDSILNPGGRVIDMTGLDRMISFDRKTGLVRAEAGASLSQCLQMLAPAGWFLPTTPGTRFVTLGGAIANDVHGKNHHSAGSFGNAVTRFKLRRTDGSVRELAPGDPLFHATIGGLGLTGVIEWVEFSARRIGSTYMAAENTVLHNLDEYFDVIAEKSAAYEWTAAWIDCLAGGDQLGKGVMSCSRWLDDGRFKLHRELPKRRVPIDAPSFAFNPLSIAAFNAAIGGVGSLRGRFETHYEPSIYPLDSIADWNRLYGPRGFYQYQCVVPPGAARASVAELLKVIAASGQGSPLVVLKDLGSVPPVGLLSFPREGSTLALDFQNQGEKTLKLMADLDHIVAEAGGRLYPAKDGRIPAEMFQSGFPNWQDFRAHVDPGLSSAFWKRVAQ